MLKIFTEAGYDKGLGHYVRINRICTSLEKSEITFQVFIDADDTVRQIIHKNYIIFEKWIDNERIKSLIDPEDVILVDSYSYNLTFFDTMKRLAKKVIVIDDNYRLPFSDCTIINPNYFGEFLEYPSNCGNQYFTGKDYTLVREEFFPAKKIAVNENVTQVLITMGGSDVLQITHQIMDQLLAINSELVLNVVTTTAYKNILEIKERIRFKDNLFTNLNASEMATLMRKVDFAVSAAGGTANELIKTICPSILISVADNQEYNFKYLVENGLAEGFSLDSMQNIDNMFSYSTRCRLVKSMQAKRSSKNASDIILKLMTTANSNI